MTTKQSRGVSAFAIIRDDAFQGPDVAITNRVKVVRVMRSQEEAVAEVQRLQAQAPADVHYFWQMTKLEDEPTS